MVGTAASLGQGLAALASIEPAFAAALELHGHPLPRRSEPGAATLLRTIVGQQVSVAAARSMWSRLEAAFGQPPELAALGEASDEALRGCGLSRQKADYARSLAALLLAGELDLARLPAEDEQAIALLTRVRGIGRWSAEIYLLFAEGRGDIWPAGDLAVQVGIGRLLGLADRPGERQLRLLAEAWRPHRGAAAILAWHSLNAAKVGL